MSEDPNDKFTFSVEGKKYVINEKTSLGERKKNTIHGPSIAIGAAITAICVIGIFFSLSVDNSEETQLIEKELIVMKTAPEPTQISMDTFFNNASPVLGNPNAPITLIEFGDYQCHFCNVYFKNTQDKVLENFVVTEKVNIIFKDFTIIGPDSFDAAHATHCANEQNKYWEYHNILYNNWAGENNGWASKQNLVKFANDIELDLKSFSQCMDSNDYNDMINQSNNDARELGISGTPAFFIVDQKNGQVLTISGAQPYEVFERVFNSIIEK